MTDADTEARGREPGHGVCPECGACYRCDGPCDARHLWREWSPATDEEILDYSRGLDTGVMQSATPAVVGSLLNRIRTAEAATTAALRARETQTVEARRELARDILGVAQGQLAYCSTPCTPGDCWGCDVTRVLQAALAPLTPGGERKEAQ